MIISNKHAKARQCRTLVTNNGIENVPETMLSEASRDCNLGENGSVNFLNALRQLYAPK
jgi:hypothetical protein